MKRLFIILAALIITLSAVSCQETIVLTNTATETVVNNETVTETVKVYTGLTPYVTSLNGIATGEYSINPAKLPVIEGVTTGAHIVGGYAEIINKNDVAITITLSPFRYGGTSYSDGGGYFEPAPDNYVDFIMLDHWGDYEVPACSSLTIPIQIDIPDDEDISNFPQRWEFQIHADWNPGGNIIWGRTQRWLLVMR